MSDKKCLICGEGRWNAQIVCEYCSNESGNLPKGLWRLAAPVDNLSAQHEREFGGIAYTRDTWHTHPAVIERREAVGWRRVDCDSECGRERFWMDPRGYRREDLPAPEEKPQDRLIDTYKLIEEIRSLGGDIPLSGQTLKNINDKCKQWTEENNEKMKEVFVWLKASREAAPLYTHSARFEFPNGDVEEIPEPGEGWEKVERRDCDKWNTVHVNRAGENGFWLHEQGGTLEVNHEAGRCWLYDYTQPLMCENARCLSWTKWRKLPDEVKEEETYTSEFPLLRGEIADVK